MANLQIKTREAAQTAGGVVTLGAVVGAIDASTVPILEEKLLSLLASGRRRVILDCREVTYINSTGMGLLVKCGDRFRSEGGEIVLAGVSAKVTALFQMLGLADLFQMFDAEEAALAHLAGEEVDPPATATVAPVEEEPVAVGPPRGFPRDAPCPACSGMLRLEAAGRFRCPRCNAFVAIPDSGHPHVITLRDTEVLEVRIPCGVEYFDALRAFAAVLARRLEYPAASRQDLDECLEALAAFVTRAAEAEGTLDVLFVADEEEILVGCVTPFRLPRESLASLRRVGAGFEVLDLPGKGSLLKVSLPRAG